MTQIWVAMCAYLLLAYLKFCGQAEASLQRIIRLLALNLFAKRDPVQLVKAEPPPDVCPFTQVDLWHA
jgi:hypothetical protein